MTYYLQYRPKQIADLDLESVRQTLTEILSGKNIPHAWLFSGPKGTGKTSSARIVAKLVNCAKPVKGEPCNQCDNCQLIDSGRSMDLLEIDAASNRGIDDIRDLREKIKLSPSHAKFKVYIIDEVHMLTNEAFNALLKTLEEPPAHAKFILCTTEFNKLPATIVSRCALVKFTRATTEELMRSLKRVVRGEKLIIKEDDLRLIAKNSDASFRDAVKILEQLSQTGPDISSKRLRDVLQRGMAGKNIDEWLMLIYQGKATQALIWFNEILNEGLNIKQFTLEATDRLREILLMRLGVSSLNEVKDIKEISDLARLKELINGLLQAGRELQGAVIASLPLELMMAELSNEPEIKSIEIKKTEVDKNEMIKSVSVPVRLTKNLGKLSLEKVVEKWSEILLAVRPHNHSLEALLKATKPSGFEGQYLQIQVFYKFHKERLEVDKYRQLIETVISQVLNQPVKVRYFLGIKKDIIKAAEEIFQKEVK